MPSREWRLANRDRHLAAQSRANAKNPAYRRAWRVLKLYGLAQDAHDALVLAAEGRCALCDKPCKNLHIDHDHATMRVRGLLCVRCNTDLSVLEPARLVWRVRAFAYLQEKTR